MSFFKNPFRREIAATVISRTFYSTPTNSDYNNLKHWCKYTIIDDDKKEYKFKENLGSQKLTSPELDISSPKEPKHNLWDVISIYQNRIIGNLLPKTSKTVIKNKGMGGGY